MNNKTLHSTMFLLILSECCRQCGITLFTFHDVSINTTTRFYCLKLKFSLHSTMFLLIRWLNGTYNNTKKALHSTMFLLIPIASGHRRKRSHFTFHDVSINTPSLTTLLTASLTLHSTMFLLILCLEVITQNHLITLHSTMFLLIHLVKHPS